MPFVNIRIYEGWGKERKDEIAKRVTGAITDVTGLPKEAVWVVIEEVKPSDWYAAGKPGSRSRSDGRGPGSALQPRGGAHRRVHEDRGRLPLHRRTPLAPLGQVSPVERHARGSSPTMVGHGRRHHLSQAVQQVQRSHLGPRGAPPRLRARLEPGLPHRAG